MLYFLQFSKKSQIGLFKFSTEASFCINSGIISFFKSIFGSVNESILTNLFKIKKLSIDSLYAAIVGRHNNADSSAAVPEAIGEKREVSSPRDGRARSPCQEQLSSANGA